MAAHRRVAVICGVVVLGALVLAWLVSAWALVTVPFAVVIGVAAWQGVGLRTTLDALGDSANDPGSGPAGLTP